MKWIANMIVVQHIGLSATAVAGLRFPSKASEMTPRARRPLVILLAALLIMAGGAYLGAGLKIVLTGDEFPATQLAFIAIGGIVALIAGIALLRWAMKKDSGPRLAL